MLTQVAGDGVTNIMPNFLARATVLQPSPPFSTARKNKTGNIEKEEEKENCLHPYPPIVFSYHVLLSTIFVPWLNKFSRLVFIVLAGKGSSPLYLCVGVPIIEESK